MAGVDDVRKDLDFLVALLRDLHAHPELGFEEERTSAIVAEHLTETGREAMGARFEWRLNV